MRLRLELRGVHVIDLEMFWPFGPKPAVEEKPAVIRGGSLESGQLADTPPGLDNQHMIFGFGRSL